MKSFILSVLVAVALTACTNYGKKVTIEGNKGEVFYKGDGVTEADAKKLCGYLKDEIHYFDNTTRQSVQLMKAKDGGYDLRFVVNEDKLKSSPDAGKAFLQIGAAMSIDLYNNQPVNIFLTDTHFKELKSLPFDKELAKELLDKMKPATNESMNPAADSTGNPNQ